MTTTANEEYIEATFAFVDLAGFTAMTEATATRRPFRSCEPSATAPCKPSGPATS